MSMQVRTWGCCLLMWACCAFGAEPDRDPRCYELRVYHATQGRLGDLQARFRDHASRLFQRHGISCVGFWVPDGNANERLVFLLSYPDREAREVSWKSFMNDPEWQQAYRESERNGRLVSRVESVFLEATEYSPEVRASRTERTRLFELRDYTAFRGRREALNLQCRDASVRLLARHGVEQVGYWVPMKGQPGADEKLYCLLAHSDRHAAERAAQALETDPEWRAAQEAAEAVAGGSLTVSNGVHSVFLLPTDYSAMR